MKVRGQGRVYLRGDMWWIAYSRHGREIRESTDIRLDPEKADRGEGKAWKLLDQRRGEIASGKFVGPKQEKVTFDALKALYEQDYDLRGLRRETADARVKHLEAFFGLDKALAITPTRLRDYQQHRLDEKADGATVNRELAALHRMFELARKQGLLSAAAVPVFPGRLKEKPPKQGFFEHDEYEEIRKHLPADYQDVLDFGYYTGWRRREVTELTWDEIDVPGGVVRLDPARTKSKAARLLPLSPPLLAVLKRREKARLVERKGDVRIVDLVFHKNGVPVGDWRKTWNSACIKAGLYLTVGAGKRAKKIPTKTFHDLRRTAARNYVRSGVPERVAMTLLGHKTRAVFDRYNIVSEADLKQAASLLAAYVGAK